VSQGEISSGAGGRSGWRRWWRRLRLI
jgi:hypothetical protein